MSFTENILNVNKFSGDEEECLQRMAEHGEISTSPYPMVDGML
jgi:hypothetical protein